MPKMIMQLNCISLRKISLSDSFTVYVCDTNYINGNEVKFEKLKIEDLKYLIFLKIKTNIDNNYNDLKLWKADIALGDKLENITDEKQIEDNEELLLPDNYFTKYFPDQDAVDKSLIFIQVPTAIKDVINALRDIETSIDIVEPDNNMPFMERDTDKAITSIIRNIENHLKGSKSKTVLVSSGAPGIGKTRYGDELFKQLKNNQNWVPSEWKNNLHIENLYLDFGYDDYQLDSRYDDGQNTTVIIGLRIAYLFFIKGKYEISFDIFRILVWEYRNIFNISNVFRSIYDYLIPQSNQHLFVFFHIDEFQLIDQWESDAVRKRKMELFKEMINSLASFMLDPHYKIFVQTFLSGTASQVVISAKESSKVSFEFVNCPQLSFKAILEIANHYAQKFNAEQYDCNIYKWMLCRSFLQLLEDTGGLPRALQYVFDECFNKINFGGKQFFDNIYQENFRTIFTYVKLNLGRNYNMYETIRKNKKLALELLYHSIYAIPVSRKTCLDPSDPNCTIENLERNTHIILNPCNDTSSEFTIKMPFFFICIYNDVLRIINRVSLEDVFWVQNGYWQSWGIFVANYDAFRTNLLIKCGKKSVRLNELYRGAYGTQSTLNIEVKLKELPIYERYRLPRVMKTDKESNYTYWMKGTYHVTKSFEKEHNKNLESNTTDITTVFTIQPIDNTISTNNCLVITENNFKDYFGSVLASRAKFFMTKDVNPNFSDCLWLKKNLPVGKVTPDKVIESRPHLSKDDFYNKFGRVKRTIEDYEENTPGKKVKFDFYPFSV